MRSHSQVLVSASILRDVVVCAVAMFCVACGLSAGDGNRGRPDAAHDAALVDAGRDANIAECSTPLDCVVVPRTCCGACGAATHGDAVAIPVSQMNQHRAAACVGGQPCDTCIGENDPELLATCTAGRCELVVTDLRIDLSACEATDECTLRFATCCECAPLGTLVIAIRRDANEAFRALTCAPDQACPECAPTFPQDMSAGCDDSRRCRVFSSGD